MICGHQWVRHEDVRVCLRCGKTLTFDGKCLHDRAFPGAVGRAKHRKRRKRDGEHPKRERTVPQLRGGN